MKQIFYARQSIDRQDIKAVCDVLRSDYLTQGPIVERFEKAVADTCGARYAVAVNSGTAALHLSCLAVGLSSGDEGITSPITFAASANCMLYCQTRPVFADIDDDTICIDPAKIEERITSMTKVIIPVHFGGHPCDMDRIAAIAKRHNITVIEDACHAIGASFKGSKIGSCRYSEMTVFSFHAVKNITTGEGGMILTNNERLYKKVLFLRSHGITRERQMMSKNSLGPWYYEMQKLGYNYRLTDIQCALGLSQLKKLPVFIEKRRAISEIYNKAFGHFDEIRLLLHKPFVHSSHHLYVIRLNTKRLTISKRTIFDEYNKRGIFVNVHYIPLYRHPYYKKIGYPKRLCKRAERYYEETVTLPLYPKMTNQDVRRVIKATEYIIMTYAQRNRRNHD